MSRARPIVALDGPAGAGKSTVARLVADRLGFLYVDTGAMYRAVALKAERLGVVDDEAAVVALADTSQITLATGAGALQVLLDGEEVTAAIRTPRLSALVSPVAAMSGVRRSMVRRQRELGREGGVVMEGRDIQTVVFPDAEVKIFLTASPAERARRRCAELQTKGVVADFATVEAEMAARDRRDATRADSPLVPAADAVTVTTDGLPIDQVVARIVDIVQERCPQLNQRGLP